MTHPIEKGDVGHKTDLSVDGRWLLEHCDRTDQRTRPAIRAMPTPMHRADVGGRNQDTSPPETGSGSWDKRLLFQRGQRLPRTEHISNMLRRVGCCCRSGKCSHAFLVAWPSATACGHAEILPSNSSARRLQELQTKRTRGSRREQRIRARREGRGSLRSSGCERGPPRTRGESQKSDHHRAGRLEGC